MYKTKTLELFREHLDLELFGKNRFSKNTYDFNLGFEINMHYLSIDLVVVGVTLWWKI